MRVRSLSLTGMGGHEVFHQSTRALHAACGRVLYVRACVRIGVAMLRNVRVSICSLKSKSMLRCDVNVCVRVRVRVAASDVRNGPYTCSCVCGRLADYLECTDKCAFYQM